MSVEVQEAKEAVRTILRYIGEDPDREGLQDTPDRVIRSWGKLYGGYKQDPENVLKAAFSDEGYDQMILLGPVEFWSTCEHHMIPFYGSVHVGYIPGDTKKVVGVSKLARVIEVYARRLQIQERMTQQIADAVEKFTGAKGVGVVVRGKHLCMVARGVEKQQSVMITSALRGAMIEQSSTRQEFMALTSGG
jgi:GTP cyclohydrolase I